jgi:hypothetical protein
MLNGLAMNGSTLPRDAAISTTVATSPYDVSRGGFSGGQVSTRSQSGGNYIVRTMSFTGITPQMQWSDRAAQSLALESTNASVSGRASGPIKLNRAFYNVSFQYDDNHRDLRTLLDIDAIGLEAVGISQDSVIRLREALLETALEALADEIHHLLEEGVAAEAKDVDTALLLGAGWPFWLGGITKYLDQAGISEKMFGRPLADVGVGTPAA